MLAKTYRKPLVVGNWKMNKTVSEAVELTRALLLELGQQLQVVVVLCPPFTALEAVGRLLENHSPQLGAQNFYPAASGAFTGEISAEMLRELYCTHVIIGHSERRLQLGETESFIQAKVKSALSHNLRPILCVGETLEAYQAGETLSVVQGQLWSALSGLAPEELEQITLAYEPVWAIGTGKVATPDQAQRVHAFLRGLLSERFGAARAHRVRLLYGGSVKPENAAALFEQPDVDGVLVGGASLDAKAFAAIVQAAAVRVDPS